jgi:tetratricopeptide (TPR) repeat protein/septum formation inhibitor-activating ATPase MinD
MKTVTFYSYKGGVGRTLALANIAMRLSEFGKKVCILDFDLEAPGVHYKFPKVDLRNRKGLVDYIYEYVQTKERPENLQEMVITLPPTIKDSEPIQLIPAGDIHDKNYWSNLSNINWTELLYKEDGILFLLDLKERIKNELNPDFLLIDSRTGITEIAGITISLLADHVTLLAVNNPENLFGCKQLLNSIQDPSRNLFNRTIQSTFVLTRIPPLDKDIDIDYAKHGSLLKKVAVQMFDDTEKYKEILIIHSDDELLLQESLKINLPIKSNKTAKKNTYHKSPITQDYLNLFDMLTQGYLTDQESIDLKRIKKAETLLNKIELIDGDKEKLSLIDQVLILNDKCAEAYFDRGCINHDLNNFKTATLDFTKAIEIKPDFHEALNNRGLAYANLEEYDQAIFDYTNTIEINFDYHLAYYNRGLAFANLGKHDMAVSDFSRAIEINPNDPDYYQERGFTYSRLKEYNKAISDYSKVIEMNPNDIGIWVKRGIAYFNQGKYEQAISDYSKSIELNSNEQIFFHRGLSYANLNKYNSAIIDYSNAIELNSDFNDAYNERGIAYSNLEQYNSSILDYTKAIEINPSNADYYINRGFSHFRIGKYLESLSDFNKAIELNPLSARVYNNRGFLFGILKDYSKSIEDLKKSIELDNTFDFPHGNLAQILFILGQKEDAKKNLGIAFSLKPEEEGLLCSLWFQVYAHLPERMIEAKKELTKLIESGSKAIGWDFTKNMEVAIAEGHPEPEELKRIAKQITEK